MDITRFARPYWHMTKIGLTYCLRKLPIFSGLPDLSLHHHGEALKETTVTVFLATIPLWLGAFISALLDSSKELDGSFNVLSFFYDKLIVTTEGGALIIYASSLISPVLYMALKERGNGQTKVPFPSKISHIMAVLVITIIAAAYFTALNTGNSLNLTIAYYVSVWLFCLAVLILYIASCYKEFSSDYKHSEVVQNFALDHAKRFKEFRGAGE